MLSIRDIALSLAIVLLLPVVFRRAFIGLLLFSWLAYMRPQDLCWGFARPQRWSFLVAAVTMAGFLSRPRKEFFARDIRSTILIVLVVVVGISCVIGQHHSPIQFNRYVEYAKIVGVALFTTTIVSTPERLRVLLWVVAMSFGFYGVKVGLAGVLSGGNMEVLRGPGGMLEDNNDFSLALCMAIPMLLHIAFSEKRLILRRGVLVMLPLTVLTVLLTHSRGGFLSLVAACGVLIWRSRNRLAGILMGLVGTVIGILVVPQAYLDRLWTIVNYQQEGSAIGRLQAWRVAIRMAIDHPVWGVGFTNFRRYYNDYATSEGEYVRVAHNSYLQIWAESGSIALTLYMFLLCFSIYRVWMVRRDAQRYFNSSWIINYATMFEASLVSFLVGGTFLNRAAFDLIYHLVGIVVAFEVIAYREMRKLERRESADEFVVGSDLSLVRPFGFHRERRRNGFRSRPLVGETS